MVTVPRRAGQVCDSVAARRFGSQREGTPARGAKTGAAAHEGQVGGPDATKFGFRAAGAGKLRRVPLKSRLTDHRIVDGGKAA